MDLSDLQVSRTIIVEAPPEQVYKIISDVTRIGELSPECKSAWWDESASPTPGAWFTGRNEREGRAPWERRCEVVIAEVGRAFGWAAGGKEEGSTEWLYRFSPVEGGTKVEESWRVFRMSEGLSALSDEQLQGLKAKTEAGMENTLANLKSVAES
jgi:Polyketide cyclase / dehydrase and lipid transport